MRHAEHLEQDMAELLWRIDVEFLARQLVDARLQLVDFGLRVDAQLGERRRIDGRPVALDYRERSTSGKSMS